MGKNKGWELGVESSGFGVRGWGLGDWSLELGVWSWGFDLFGNERNIIHLIDAKRQF